MLRVAVMQKMGQFPPQTLTKGEYTQLHSYVESTEVEAEAGSRAEITRGILKEGCEERGCHPQVLSCN